MLATEQYQAIHDCYARAAESQQGRFSRLGNGKLLTFAALAAGVFFLVRSGYTLAHWLLCAALLLLFVALTVRQSQVKRQLRFSRGMQQNARRYLTRIQDQRQAETAEASWQSFSDTGAEFAEADHPYAEDLDLLGPGSLWQRINLAHSWHGRRALAADLLHPAYPDEQIAVRQEAVAELATQPHFACELEYHTAAVEGEKNLPQIIEKLSDGRRYLPNAPLRWLLRLLPLLTVALLVAAVLSHVQALYLPVFGLIVAQLLLWLLAMPRTSPYLAAADLAPLVMGNYLEALRLVEAQTFASPLLRDIQGKLAEAQTAFDRLDRIVNRASVKSYGVFYYLLNMLLLWDFDCAFRLSDWKARYGAGCERWFQRLGELESLLSLSVLGTTCEPACLPTVTSGAQAIQAQKLGHPLLTNRDRVCNDFTQEGELLIISGSNMSGKTTFLRTVGLNLLLARTGGYVCAERLSCGLYSLISSMRVRDDLTEGISSFYAELRRIARIVAAARESADLYFLIDEIFRGTNSEDRLEGAGAVIRELAGREALGLITTHDLTLCDLEGELKRVRNYSFAETYEGTQMSFDYRLHPGKSSSTNAKYLMRLVGIQVED